MWALWAAVTSLFHLRHLNDTFPRYNKKAKLPFHLQLSNHLVFLDVTLHLQSLFLKLSDLLLYFGSLFRDQIVSKWLQGWVEFRLQSGYRVERGPDITWLWSSDECLIHIVDGYVGHRNLRRMWDGLLKLRWWQSKFTSRSKNLDLGDPLLNGGDLVFEL